MYRSSSKCVRVFCRLQGGRPKLHREENYYELYGKVMEGAAVDGKQQEFL